MLRKTVLAALVAVLTLPLAADAGQRKQTKRFTGTTVKVRLVDTVNNQNVYAGPISNAPLGRGAAVVRVTGNTPEGAFIVVGTAFFDKGTLKIRFTDTATQNPDGSITFTSTDGRITGGTGRYRNATGRFTFNGSAPSIDATQTHTLNGSVTF